MAQSDSPLRHPYRRSSGDVNPLPSTGVSLQTPLSDGIFDGILTTFRETAFARQAFQARLNIIARYVERMLSASQDGYKPLK
ncbi:hypothetical protein P3T20_002231 [Paraburkholderia sp. GAS206C]